MIKATRAIYSFLCRKSQGAAMAEYGLLLLAIAIVVLVGAQVLGTSISSLYSTVAGDFTPP